MKKILIIEDDEKITTALTLRLKAEGYETITAQDALTGLSQAVRNTPDLLLLDISMPAGNGFTVAERVQENIEKPPPIIFLTASRQAGFREKAEKLGAVGYFEKPFEAQELLTAIREAI